MKKLLLLILVTIFTLCTLLNGCNANTEPGKNNGHKITTRQFDYDGFDKIIVTSAFEVQIMQGVSYSISVTCDDFSRIKLEKDDDILYVARQGIKWLDPFYQIPAVSITLPNLNTLRLAHASKGVISNFYSDDNLKIDISGSSTLSVVNISAASLFIQVTGSSRLQGTLEAINATDFTVSGSSIVELIGNTNNIVAKVSGSSKCNLINYPTCNANMDVRGGSDIWINLDGRLKASVSGRSNVTYLGNPAPIEIETSDSSYLCIHHGIYTQNSE
ncbi:MAG: DUF2807 domain-containing protein [Dehalococcoidales bacterium]|nr:DUF2807 domain-containing protein [Dehalococcoidales bacterium]